MYFTAAPSPTEPPPSSAQEQDEDPLDYRPPTLTTTSTSASSSLPLTPRTAYLGRFSTGRSYQPSLPGHREEDESQSVALSSTSQFAFRPPPGPVSGSLSPFGRPGSMVSVPSAPSPSGTGLARQQIPLSTYSFLSYGDLEEVGPSVPSTSGSSSEATKPFTLAGSGLEKYVSLHSWDPISVTALFSGQWRYLMKSQESTSRRWSSPSRKQTTGKSRTRHSWKFESLYRTWTIPIYHA